MRHRLQWEQQFILYNLNFICKGQEQYTIKISSKKIFMYSSKEQDNINFLSQSQLKKSSLKKLTRLLKATIEKAITKGDYDDALKELLLVSPDYHWIQCKQAYVLWKKNLNQQAMNCLQTIVKKNEQCPQCTQLFNLLPFKLANEKFQSSLKPTDIKEEGQAFNRFLHHLKLNQCQFKNIQIVEVSQGYRIVRACETIQKDEIVMAIPIKLMITVELAKQSSIGIEIEPFMNALRSPKHSLLAIFLLFQETKGQSSNFYHYIRILPKNLENFPIFYNQNLLLELKNTFFYHVLSRKKYDLFLDFKKLQDGSQFAKTITFEDFQRARMIVSSRIFGVIINGNKTDALVPLADMLNHSTPKMTGWSYEDERQAFVVRNIDGIIKSGEEIHDSYGSKCNSRFLLNYGFTQPNNVANEVGIKLREHLNSSYLRLTKDLSSPQFEIFLDTCRLTVRGSQRNEQILNEVSMQYESKEVELEVWKYIHDEISHEISSYPTTIQHDEKLLKQKELSYNLRKCIEIRLCEKQILRFYLEMSKAMIMLFKGRIHKGSLPQYEPYLSRIPLS